MDQKITVYAVVGPTASGKSALALELCRRHGGEIISCDSMQLYRRMNIGTAKVTPEEQAFLEAADEQFEALSELQRRRFRNKR